MDMGVNGMNKIFLFFFVSLFLITLISAESNPCGNSNTYLGTFQQGRVIELKQVCDTCTYVNLSSITSPDSTFTTINDRMTKKGVDYNYTFTSQTSLGCYSYSVYGDKDGAFKTETIDFKVTPSGQQGSENIVFIVIVILLVYGIALFGFFGRNEIMSLIGGLAMILLGGVYFITEGIVIYRDWLTNGLAYFTLALGVYFSFMAAYSLYED